MRVLTGIFITLSAAVVVASAAKSTLPILPKQGVKTPGVQIPFSDLKPETSLKTPDKPAWVFFSTSLFVPAKDRLDKIDVKTNKAGDPVAGLKKPCGGMMSAFGSLWVPTCGDGSLVRMDPKTFKVTATIPGGASDVRGTLAVSSDSIWLLTDSKATLSRIDPDQNAVIAEMRLPADCTHLVFGETALWLTCPSENKIYRINTATNVVEKTIEVSAKPEAIAIGEGSVWVLCGKDGKIDRIDPKTNKVTKTIETNVPGVDGDIVFGEGALWVTQNGFPLTRIDTTSESVAQQFFGGGGGAIRTSPGALWLSNLNDGTLLRIDPKRVRATLSE
jgi:virginiamycin B lyase